MYRSLIIARRELLTYFKTWNGYIIAALVLFMDGVLFNSFAIGSTSKFSSEVLSDFFYFASGLSVVAGLFLSMRLVAEEKQNGTLVLLFTTPTTEREIIYGKFISAFIFALLLHLVSLYLPALIYVHGRISVGHLFSGYLVLFFLSSASIAISIFASTLAKNQLIAGVLGAFFLVVFLIIWMLASITNSPFKDFFSYIAIHNNHFTPFAKGIFETKHVIYYISITFFFLECAVKTLESRRLKG